MAGRTFASLNTCKRLCPTRQNKGSTDSYADAERRESNLRCALDAKPIDDFHAPQRKMERLTDDKQTVNRPEGQFGEDGKLQIIKGGEGNTGASYALEKWLKPRTLACSIASATGSGSNIIAFAPKGPI